MNDLRKNIELIRKRIEKACFSCGRPVSEVALLLATKTIDAHTILKAFQLNALLIGENRVQEIVEKHDLLSQVPHTTHLIGPLQSNKITKVIDKVQCIESIDNFELAKKINNKLLLKNANLNILIEVNTSGEKTKHGCTPDEVINLVMDISQLKYLHIKGLMTIGTLTDDKTEIRRCFKLLKSISQKIENEHFEGVAMDILSMGMSDDFEIAIEEGATEVRIGSSIFGKRTI